MCSIALCAKKIIVMSFRIDESARVAVIGYGSWATALVKMLLENEPVVGWHIRNGEVAGHILEHGNNPKYLSGVHFDTGKLHISGDVNEIVSWADIVVLATPSAFLGKTLEPLTVSLEDKFVLSAIKGIIPDSYVTVAEYVNEHYGLPFDRIGIITGPCHAEEVALERLSYLNLVCKSEDNARMLAGKFSTPYINTNTATDIYGTEYAAVLKNIYAIAVGICHGLGYGDNFQSVLIANAAKEMNHFLESTYPSERDTNTSAYLGDLLVTSYSQFSRNRSFGMMIGKGYSVRSAQIEMNMVAEGYYASYCIEQINRSRKVVMPIADTVYRILYMKRSAAAEIKTLTGQLR